jgi:pilus assembly protein Flp/PilA
MGLLSSALSEEANPFPTSALVGTNASFGQSRDRAVQVLRRSWTIALASYQQATRREILHGCALYENRRRVGSARRPPHRKGKREMVRLTLFVIDGLSAIESRFSREERGQGLVEYSLILALISIVAIVLMKAIGDNIKDVLTTVRDALDS